MKSNAIDLSSFKGLQELSVDQMQSIDGGGEFWDRVSYAAGVFSKVIYTFAKDAIEYQQSLPPNLKK